MGAGSSVLMGIGVLFAAHSHVVAPSLPTVRLAPASTPPLQVHDDEAGYAWPSIVNAGAFTKAQLVISLANSAGAMVTRGVEAGAVIDGVTADSFADSARLMIERRIRMSFAMEKSVRVVQ